MLSTASVSVYPDTAEATLYGGPNVANDAVITGRVVVTGRSARQVASLQVTLRAQRGRRFQGQQSVTPPTQLQAVLVADGKAAVTHEQLSARAHSWQFSITVPGSTAETVFARTSFVAYELVAEAGVSGTFAGTVQSKPIAVAIKRAPPPDSVWAATAGAALFETADWRGQLQLALAADSRILHSDDQALAIRGIVRPLVKGLQLRRAAFQLVERIVLSSDSSSASRTVADIDVDIDPDQCTSSLLKQEGIALDHETSTERTLSVPTEYAGIQYDVHRGPIRTYHELALSVSIVDVQGSVHNLRLASPVFVLPRPCRAALPRYEDTPADRLVSPPALRRDSNFWDQFVLIDTTNSSAHARPEPALDACPLALQGYRPSDLSQAPPPSYPGAAHRIERTVVDHADVAQMQPLRRRRSRERLAEPFVVV
ncbi:hypothetical protein IWW36_002436 [Coemansia brasiliensis]|uniref:Arrestin-like N-terminal domain-containing protein n=1 Tax=Coemansia brasiliensis TaxID=2650707 RepID=A0A9W8IFW6_9FUNG|nr:hypothetical protein IWW36_002436 [Coemansia brasiliensis]